MPKDLIRRVGIAVPTEKIYQRAALESRGEGAPNQIKNGMTMNRILLPVGCAIAASSFFVALQAQNTAKQPVAICSCA
jgi:hypothetical protein